MAHMKFVVNRHGAGIGRLAEGRFGLLPGQDGAGRNKFGRLLLKGPSSDLRSMRDAEDAFMGALSVRLPKTD